MKSDNSNCKTEQLKIKMCWIDLYEQPNAILITTASESNKTQKQTSVNCFK